VVVHNVHKYTDCSLNIREKVTTNKETKKQTNNKEIEIIEQVHLHPVSIVFKETVGASTRSFRFLEFSS
jgi:hypothetical protein